MIVLDASALLAVILREPGADAAAPRLAGALLSTANLAEVLSRVAQVGGDPEVYLNSVRAMGVELAPVSASHALDAAKLRPLTRRQGLSLGDRLCIALAREREATVLTMDRVWLEVDLGVPVECPR